MPNLQNGKMMRSWDGARGAFALISLVIVTSSVACSAPVARPSQTAQSSAAENRAPTPRLRIIGTNDFHGALEARPDPAGRPRGGAVALARAIKIARAECSPPACYSILVDAGDEFQGQAPSTIARGKPVF